MDSQVSAALDRTTDAAGADRSTSIRRSQSRERARAIEEISSGQKEIAKLQEERAPKAAGLRKVEAEVGPIKYIAALIYEDSSNQDTLEKAVRWVIILIVFVFDPLAVLMFIAYNQTVSQSKQEEELVNNEKQFEENQIDLKFDDDISIGDHSEVEKIKFTDNP